MEISVVIPVFNEEEYIKKCLQALQRQTRRPEEIIVVNNNSTDRSVEIAKTFSIKIVDERKQGMIQARDRGFNEAKSELIARIDADTIPGPHWVESILDVHNTKHADAYTGPFTWYDFPLQSTIFTSIYQKWMKFLVKSPILLGPNMVITRSIWNKVKDEVCLDNSRVHEDIDLGLHILKKNGRIVFDESIKVETSARRIKEDPISFFLEYPWRLHKTFNSHK